MSDALDTIKSEVFPRALTNSELQAKRDLWLGTVNSAGIRERNVRAYFLYENSPDGQPTHEVLAVEGLPEEVRQR